MPKFSTDLPLGLSPILRRRFCSLYIAISLTFVLSFLWVYHQWEWVSRHFVSESPTVELVPLHPPLYGEWHQLELQLPHQNWSKSTPDAHDKLLFFGGHVVGASSGAGWGNALQEHLLNAYLNYRAGTTYVFNNYTWHWDMGMPYSDFNGHEIPSRIPYSALIRGPTIGAPFPPGHSAPRAVHKDYWDHICPNNMVEVRREHSKSANKTIEEWTKIVRESEQPCVSAWTDLNQVFSHHSTFGVRHSVLDIWDDFVVSPIITHLGWSTLVELAFDVNRHFFMDMPTWEPYLTSIPFTTNRERYTMLPGLVVIHLRRGDYEWHCQNLADWREDFVTFNTLPEMTPESDLFVVPEPGGDDGAVRKYYRKHCYPSVDEIVQKVMEVRETPAGHGLKKMYIMTNGRQPFLDELKAALSKAAPWDSIASNRDIVLSWQQKYIAQAVDQLVAQRAQVLIGNGFSTLTSHAVMMRKANGFPIEGTRLW